MTFSLTSRKPKIISWHYLVSDAEATVMPWRGLVGALALIAPGLFLNAAGWTWSQVPRAADAHGPRLAD